MAAPTVNGRLLIFASAADATTDYVHIDHIRWVKPTTAAHDLVITNTAGDTIAAAAVDTTVADIEIPMYGFTSLGLIMATLDSGTVHVYTRAT